MTDELSANNKCAPITILLFLPSRLSLHKEQAREIEFWNCAMAYKIAKRGTKAPLNSIADIAHPLGSATGVARIEKWNISAV